MRAQHMRGATLAVSLALTVATTAGHAAGSTVPPGTTEESTPSGTGGTPSLEFVGPNGEVPTPAEELELSDEEIAQVQEGGYTAAFVWHENSPFIQAVESGATAMFDELGIEVVSSTTAEFDAARQANNVESALALNPDIIVTIPVDPVLAAEAFRPAIDAGVKLVILTVPPAGYVHGEDFVGIVTTTVPQYGQLAAQMLGEALGGEGDVGWIFHDAEFWITNMRDQAFRDWLEHDYPDTEVVAEEGFTDPARTGDLASAMLTRNPDLDGIYVAWATAAAGVLESLRNEGRTDTAVVTNDLEAPLAIDMCQGGNVVGVVANPAVNVGENLGVVSAYGMLDKPAPEMSVVAPLAVTSENIVEGWNTEFGEDPPAEVQEACGVE